MHPSFLCWPFLSLSFFMHALTLSQGFPSDPLDLSFPRFHHSLSLASILSAIPLLPSVFPAAIRANQIPEQLCKAISAFPLIPRGGEQSWTIRLFRAAPSLINTINNRVRRAHLCCQWVCAGHSPESIPGLAGCPTAAPAM